MRHEIKSNAVIIIILTIILLINKSNILNQYIIQTIIFILSITVLSLSADTFTRYAVTLGNKIGLSKLATGVLIIAVGTSAPEFFSSLSAAIHHKDDIVIGNVLGTIIANTLLGIGIGSLFIAASSKISTPKKIKFYPSINLSNAHIHVTEDVLGNQMSIFFISIILTISALYDGSLSTKEGIVFIILLIYYLFDVYKTKNSDDNTIENEVNELLTPIKSIPILILFLISSLTFLFIASESVVSSITEGAKIFNISEGILSTTFLAIGTSIPEISIAIALAKKNETDGLFGAIIGSNIFDLLGIFGIISLFTTLTMDTELLYLLLASIFIMFLLTITVMNDKKVSKLEGLGLLSIFYMFILVLTKYS